jgi:hypothetical protein
MSTTETVFDGAKAEAFGGHIMSVLGSLLSRPVAGVPSRGDARGYKDLGRSLCETGHRPGGSRASIRYRSHRVRARDAPWRTISSLRRQRVSRL